jgi:hypothetical protein
MAKKEKPPKEPKPPKPAKAPKAPKPPKPVGPRISYPNDIYTALVGIALVITAGAVSFAIYRCNELFGTPFPGFAG